MRTFTNAALPKDEDVEQSKYSVPSEVFTFQVGLSFAPSVVTSYIRSKIRNEIILEQLPWRITA